MCGITGVYCWGIQRPSPALLKALLLENEPRGHDSTGFAYQDSENQPQVYKNPLKATDFISTIPENIWEAAARSKIWLGHTRSSTKGTPADNVNNHPVVCAPWVVVHNGVVTNDDDLFEHYQVSDRFAEVDTAAIPLVLSQETVWHNSLQNLAQLDGNVTAALWTRDVPDSLSLVRLGSNDVHLFMVPSLNALVFSSSPYIHKYLIATRLATMSFMLATKMNRDRVLVLVPKRDECRLYAVNRNPILRPKRVVLVVSPVLGTAAKVAGYKWSSPNRGVRPYADFSECATPPSFNQWDLDLNTDIATAAREDKLVVPTPYGRWVAPVGEPFFFFRPHKAMKKYMTRNQFPKWWDAKDRVETATCGQQLSAKLFWEHYVIETVTRSPISARVSLPGLLCPWCGVGARTYSVKSNSFVCEWCEIKSLDPTNYQVEDDN